MVVGLEVFREAFAGYAGQYLLIGGTAATFAFEEVGEEFRATKDLDVVLVVEALTAEFAERFWRFVRDGGYRARVHGDARRPRAYRFEKPRAADFPRQVELFCRRPDNVLFARAGHLTPVPFDDAASSLSAILMDDEYYAFTVAGVRDRDGLPWVGADRLIPLKAAAWLDLTARRARGAPVHEQEIEKHRRDVVALSALLVAGALIPLPPRVARDLAAFVGSAIARAEPARGRLMSGFGLREDGPGAD